MTTPTTPQDKDRGREQGPDNADPHPQSEQGYDRGKETANSGGGSAKPGDKNNPLKRAK